MNINPDQFNISQIPSEPKVLINSSSISGYAYDATNYILDVFYKGKHKQSIYRYYMVFPSVVSQIFDQGGSIGLKTRNLLKDVRHQKLA